MKIHLKFQKNHNSAAKRFKKFTLVLFFVESLKDYTVKMLLRNFNMCLRYSELNTNNYEKMFFPFLAKMSVISDQYNFDWCHVNILGVVSTRLQILVCLNSMSTIKFMTCHVTCCVVLGLKSNHHHSTWKECLQFKKRISFPKQKKTATSDTQFTKIKYTLTNSNTLTDTITQHNSWLLQYINTIITPLHKYRIQSTGSQYTETGSLQ